MEHVVYIYLIVELIFLARFVGEFQNELNISKQENKFISTAY